MGIAGSGKGTQGKLLADEYGFHWISTGELLRLYITGERRRHIMSGKLLDDNEMINVLDRILKTLEDDDECVLDGFPRTITQAQWLLDQAKAGRFTIKEVIHLVATEQAVKERLIKRGRPDDNDAAIAIRFHEFDKTTLPILKWFRQEDIPVVEINAEQSVEAVHRDIIKNLTI